ncbi:hypothetical protein GGS26DRAFT_535314 [Hypomontagnella submonticulosa]|nr:hypothetical protein GGS26DRAFT_535314 [Hypomontagnella submonticulosa]
MHFTSLVAALAALASTSKAAAVPQSDPYVGDLRTFSLPGCWTENQGVGTFTESMTGTCNLYAVQFRSLYIHITSGWVCEHCPSGDQIS